MKSTVSKSGENDIDFSKVQLIENDKGMIILTNGDIVGAKFWGTVINGSKVGTFNSFLIDDFKKLASDRKVTLQND